MRTSVAIVAWALAAPLGAAGQGGAATGVRVESREETYRVDAPTLSGVIARLNDMRLEGEEGPRSQGLTRYGIRPEWAPTASGGTCRVGRLTLYVTLVVTLPEWPAADAATAEEQERWARILGAIRDHEHTHRDLVLEAAGELYDELAGLQARGCRGLRQSFAGTMALAGRRLDEAHAELDAATPDRLIG